MEIKDLTQEALREQNPELCNALMQSAIQAERERMQDIDDLTPDGAEYREMADEAKKTGMSAMDFHKKIVAYQKQKGKNYLENRAKETASAALVKGGAAEDQNTKDNEEAELDAYQKQMKAVFESVHTSNETMM